MKTQIISKPITSLLLDPNNYRIIDKSDYLFVNESEIEASGIQLRTYNLLVGENNINIQDLITRFKTHGILDIDQIWVRQVGEHFMVIEGNRRVAALKYLYFELQKGNDVGVLQESDFENIQLEEIIDEDLGLHLKLDSDKQLSGKFEEQLYQIFSGLKKLEHSLTKEIIVSKPVSKYFSSLSQHFTELHVENYRKLVDVKMTNLCRVNIFVGGNNMGKTTLLESCILLSQLDDFNTYFELENYRGKFSNKYHQLWINNNFTNTKLSGIFNTQPVSLSITKQESEDDFDKMDYLSTLQFNAMVDKQEINSNVHLFVNRNPQMKYESVKILCRSAFTSPYRYNVEQLEKAHADAVSNGYFEDIKTYIQQNMDATITNIELVKIDGQSRFMVSSTSLSKPTDLTKYGEGLQRIFEIALLLGYCKDGILCIDELDSAIHKTLLISFTQFIQSMAKAFNVQVFLSTHSKECIDAFVQNDYPDDELMAYRLQLEDGAVVCKFMRGEKLGSLLASINIDIR